MKLLYLVTEFLSGFSELNVNDEGPDPFVPPVQPPVEPPVDPPGGGGQEAVVGPPAPADEGGLDAGAITGICSK